MIEIEMVYVYELFSRRERKVIENTRQFEWFTFLWGLIVAHYL